MISSRSAPASVSDRTLCCRGLGCNDCATRRPVTIIPVSDDGDGFQPGPVMPVVEPGHFPSGIVQQLDMIDQVIQAGDQRLLTLLASGLPLVVTLKSILFSSITDSYQTLEKTMQRRMLVTLTGAYALASSMRSTASANNDQTSGGSGDLDAAFGAHR